MTANGSDLKPYAGPHPFTREDGVRFFGRDQEASDLARRWRRDRLTILHGPSGVGKTSLLSAGVLPRLHPTAADVLPVGGVLRSSLVPAAIVPAGGDAQVFALLASWAPFESPVEFTGQAISAFLRRRKPRRAPSGEVLPVLAAVDHLDDLFTGSLTDPVSFLDQLAEALDAEPRLRLLLVISDEHLGSLTRHPGLRRHLGDGTYRLEPLGAEPALDACRRPVEDLGWAFAPGVAEALVDDLRQVPGGLLPAVEPVHLQVVCTALWQGVRAEPRRITLDDLPAVDKVLAEFGHFMIDEVAHDHFHGDADELTDLVRRLAGGDTDAGAALPDRVVMALVDRHVLCGAGAARRIEIRPRLVRPLTLGRRSAKREDQHTDSAYHLEAAERALHEGHLDLALKHADGAVQRSATDPGQGHADLLRPRIESLRADIAHVSGDQDTAIDHYRRAIQLYTTLRGTDHLVATLYTAIGRILIRQGRYREAVRELRAALRRGPGEPAIHTELAWALWYGGQEGVAIDVLNDALALEGSAPEALRARGEIMSDLERPVPALRDLDRLRPFAQSSTKAAYALALALSGDVPHALRTIPPLDSERDGSTLLRAARVMWAAGNRSEAARLARRAQQGSLPPRLAAEAEHLIGR
ncbi:tetratricopeptide repeat protein [Nonomuraea jiangxiensis]|uniref:Tetratricopeptide repeat-containing protein n=1 Tax=Nonomuraea jiangxiensis TaxID=633440 RepID=A0A1G9FB42_9ACTN|nr:tetratricopeptide repeat protein [Nonomuraea jiangxiensis]SDK85463.1 Tetratricopeptide repeat-containing protein [Nonomuraea jiangxiensis]